MRTPTEISVGVSALMDSGLAVHNRECHVNGNPNDIDYRPKSGKCYNKQSLYSVY